MKSLYYRFMVLLGATSAIALTTTPSVNAQSYSMPLTNGSFAITNDGGGNAVRNINFLSPAGTLNIVGAAPIVHFQPGITLSHTPTAIGVVLEQVNGSVQLTDGRSGTFQGGVAGVETQATITGVDSWTPTQANYFAPAMVPLGSTANFTVRNGYLTFPTADLSNYPASGINIPVTGGTFVINAPAGAAPETITVTGLLSPLGTANLTFSSPILVNPDNAYPITLSNVGEPSLPVLLGGVANGTVKAASGQVTTVRNGTFLLEGAVSVTTGGVYTLPEIFPDARVITGRLVGNGMIRGIRAPQVKGRPVNNQSDPVIPPDNETPQPPVDPITIPTPPIGRPEPVVPPDLLNAQSDAGALMALSAGTGRRTNTVEWDSAFAFNDTIALGSDPASFLLQRPEPIAVLDEEGSPLQESRIHPGLNAY